MRPALVIAAALAALSCAGAFAAPCTAPTTACAATLPPPPPPAAERPQRPRGDIQYDPRAARDRDLFLTIYAQAAACMREGSVAMLRQGSRQSEDIRSFTGSACSRTLHGWLTDKEGMSERQADLFVDHMTGKALAAALRGPDSITVR